MSRCQFAECSLYFEHTNITEPASQAEAFANRFREIPGGTRENQLLIFTERQSPCPRCLLKPLWYSMPLILSTLTKDRVLIHLIRRFSKSVLPKWPNNWLLFSTDPLLLQRNLMTGGQPLRALSTRRITVGLQGTTTRLAWHHSWARRMKRFWRKQWLTTFNSQRHYLGRNMVLYQDVPALPTFLSRGGWSPNW